MFIDFLIQHFSYGLLFVWSIFEGEIGLTFAGYLSKEGGLYYPYVLAIAITGALIGDSILFLIGYFSKSKTEAWLHSYQDRVQRTEGWFQRYGGWVIVFERFIYGTHIPALLIIGMSGFSFLRFFLLDIIGVVLWAVTFTTLGFLFGQTIIDILALVQRHLTVILLAAMFFFIIRQLYLIGEESSSDDG